MRGSATVVLDVGKTNAKLSLWTRDGQALARRVRRNAEVAGPGYRALDVGGIEAWLRETLREFAGLADVRAIIPVGHGAAAALVSGGALFTPPMDYEDEASEADQADYARQRDDFEVTGSPRLPQGLNLGLQLHRLEATTGPWPDDLTILPWPQYWAWRLSGVAASEASSLGCHSDLWRAYQGRPSRLAVGRGWAARMGPLRHAGEALGPITPEWVRLTGLSPDCQVHCGLHDSNAALLAARGHPAIAHQDATILSTGTWFVAMRSPAPDAPPGCLPTLDEARDCLTNVDVSGRPIPSARFMGGREAELIAGLDTFHLTEDYDPETLLQRLPGLIAAGSCVLPSFAPGVGPFPDHPGRWVNPPDDRGDKRAVLGLYLALMADVALDLIGSRERLLVEGRFAEAQVFVRALATLRPDQAVYVSNAQDDVPYGALRLLNPSLPPPSPLVAVAPLPFSLDDYRRGWRAAVV
ncbi:MAG: carbohydrate kinase [Alphaproteobacteria bacterium]|nr:carbohydrate kinase [Alphaproteobacteria bacterium]MBU1516756.1 carbohydrate kinase [Alphaproteobacteria bacterium]MBU2092450.1 carbohydrate kinase [Alphaproteobacteria bacterium]MBU2152696.1 carbohydrate kinase [Alphaproteobacteria bacterium]MBU2305630.1 carbohydrate kinase [Alphaproteobacteria bacterium]